MQRKHDRLLQNLQQSGTALGKDKRVPAKNINLRQVVLVLLPENGKQHVQ